MYLIEAMIEALKLDGVCCKEKRGAILVIIEVYILGGANSGCGAY